MLHTLSARQSTGLNNSALETIPAPMLLDDEDTSASKITYMPMFKYNHFYSVSNICIYYFLVLTPLFCDSIGALYWEMLST